MLPILIAGLALICSLAASAFSWQLWRATIAARASAPGELLVRMAEVEQEWADTLDSNTRFLKRIAERDRREAKKAAKTVEDAPEPTNGAPVGGKAQLRALARQRGLL